MKKRNLWRNNTTNTKKPIKWLWICHASCYYNHWSTLDMLDFVPALLTWISHNLHSFLEQDLELLGSILHLLFKPSHHKNSFQTENKWVVLCWRNWKCILQGDGREDTNLFKVEGVVESNASDDTWRWSVGGTDLKFDLSRPLMLTLIAG